VKAWRNTTQEATNRTQLPSGMIHMRNERALRRFAAVPSDQITNLVQLQFQTLDPAQLARDLGPDCILERRSSRTVKNWSNDGQQFVTVHVKSETCTNYTDSADYFV
jgi:hypothetical protein